MRAPRTRKILEVDTVASVEDNTEIVVLVRLSCSNGVCVVGMYENVQLRNLGDPFSSMLFTSHGKYWRNRSQANIKGSKEVRLLHSTEEIG